MNKDIELVNKACTKEHEGFLLDAEVVISPMALNWLTTPALKSIKDSYWMLRLRFDQKH